MPLDRRSLILGAAALSTVARADEGAPMETIALWPDAPPGGPTPRVLEVVGPNGAVSGVTVPRLMVRRPAKPNGAAVLIIGGGGYRRIGIAKESLPTAQWLATLGVTSFILFYRLPADGWHREAPFQDAQRAMRLIRGRAHEFGIDPAQVGIVGYSAGGHCAGMIATTSASARYAPIDPLDSISARPDLAALIYPVLTLIPPYITKISTQSLLGDTPTMDQRMAFSVEHLVTNDTPRTFLVHADDDPIAPPENSSLMFAALRGAHVPTALHMFGKGGHGFNVGNPDSEVQAWPRLFATWAGFA